MTKDLANIRIYGDSDGAVSVAPKGSTMPTNLDALIAPFEEAGWLSEDGIDIKTDQDSKAFSAYQGGKIVRRRITSSEDSFKFQALEENAVVLGLYLPGMEAVTNTGITTITPAEGISTDERCFVVDTHDGDVHKRYAVVRGEVFNRGTIPHKNTDMTVYEFEVVMYEYVIITNNPALEVAP
jgi:hypothetical protein